MDALAPISLKSTPVRLDITQVIISLKTLKVAFITFRLACLRLALDGGTIQLTILQSAVCL